MGRTTNVTDALTYTQLTGYDISGVATSSTDQLGRVSKPTYDPYGRGLTVKQEIAIGKPTDSDTLSAYDAAGRLTATRDAVCALTTYNLDQMGRVTQTINAQGIATRNFYDQKGELVASVDEQGAWTKYQYNQRGWATLQTASTWPTLSLRPRASYRARFS
jgi:YD repeat-containing protein